MQATLAYMQATWEYKQEEQACTKGQTGLAKNSKVLETPKTHHHQQQTPILQD
jgi:hypothetical protein